MAKKKYYTPVWFNEDPGDHEFTFGDSQGTSGEDSQFTWDPLIEDNDKNMFWNNYDETDLAAIDTDDDLYISKAEFDKWYESEQPW